ncbi:hypothetical protein M0813_15373 [Anaeramoeba flamelloides]|uniref:MULE transposase domain-containing protein n=1 Tax=Anaeramoeba flamelloides TaxID=1746091 RepID=A0ABQ8Z104_9EUKA|nr:hypothetical protein M0813_15373 [Anaeramoeba flamelloides]
MYKSEFESTQSEPLQSQKNICNKQKLSTSQIVFSESEATQTESSESTQTESTEETSISSDSSQTIQSDQSHQSLLTEDENSFISGSDYSQETNSEEEKIKKKRKESRKAQIKKFKKLKRELKKKKKKKKRKMKKQKKKKKKKKKQNYDNKKQIINKFDLMMQQKINDIVISKNFCHRKLCRESVIYKFNLYPQKIIDMIFQIVKKNTTKNIRLQEIQKEWIRLSKKNDIVPCPELKQLHKIIQKITQDYEIKKSSFDPEEITKTKNNKQFLWCYMKVPSIIVMWTSPILFNCLLMCKHIYIDGTFSLAPKTMAQFFIIQGYFPGFDQYIPLIWVLLDSKTQIIYEILFQTIKSLSKNTFNPILISCDFEQAIINAVEKIFTNSIIVGCFFHMKQALLKKAKNLRIKNMEKRDELIFKLGKLSTTKPENILKRFDQIVKKNPQNRSLFIYFYNTFINRIHPRYWCHSFLMNEDVTNNSLENYNGKITKLIGTKKAFPHIAIKIQEEEEYQRNRVLNHLQSVSLLRHKLSTKFKAQKNLKLRHKIWNFFFYILFLLEFEFCALI